MTRPRVFVTQPIAESAMKIASEVCVYTNDEFVFEEL